MLHGGIQYDLATGEALLRRRDGWICVLFFLSHFWDVLLFSQFFWGKGGERIEHNTRAYLAPHS